MQDFLAYKISVARDFVAQNSQAAEKSVQLCRIMQSEYLHRTTWLRRNPKPSRILRNYGSPKCSCLRNGIIWLTKCCAEFSSYASKYPQRMHTCVAQNSKVAEKSAQLMFMPTKYPQRMKHCCADFLSRYLCHPLCLIVRFYTIGPRFYSYTY